MRQLYSLVTFKDKNGEVKLRSKDYIRMVMASRKNSKEGSKETSVQLTTLNSAEGKIKKENSYEDRPYSYMNGRRDSLK